MLRQIACVAMCFLTIYTAIIYDSQSLVFLAGVELLPLLLFLVLLVQRSLFGIAFSQKKYVLEPGQDRRVALRMAKKGLLPLRRVSFRVDAKNMATGERVSVKASQAVGRAMAQTEEQAMAQAGVSLPEMGYGVWRLSCAHIRIYDFLLFAYVRKWKRPVSRLVCMPKSYPVKGIFFQEDAQEMVSQEVRAYRQGDSLHSIHWKLSAKKEELLVREPERQEGFSLVFGLNVSRLDHVALELVFSLLLAFVDARCQVLLLWQPTGEEEPRRFPVGDAQEAAAVMELLMETQAGACPVAHGMTGERELWLSDVAGDLAGGHEGSHVDGAAESLRDGHGNGDSEDLASGHVDSVVGDLTDSHVNGVGEGSAGRYVGGVVGNVADGLAGDLFLSMNGRIVQTFSHEDLEGQLAEMELVL